MLEVPGRPAPALEVENLLVSDLDATGAAHIALLPNGLFPRLGHGFVRRWHRTFIMSEHAEALGIRAADGSLMGILLGTTDNARYTAEVLKREKWRLGLHGAIGLGRRPSLALQFLRTRALRYSRRLARRPRTENGAGSSLGAAPVAVVHVVITMPGHRRKGVASHLLEHYERRVRERGVDLMQLVTREGTGAADLYLRQGWRLADRHLDKDGAAVLRFDRVVAGT